MDEEQKWAEFRQLVQEMRDAMAVDFGIKRRHEDRIKEHEEWLQQMAVTEARHLELTQKHEKLLERHEKVLARHEEFVQRHEAFIQQHEAMMAGIDEKLERIADLILRGRSTNGNQT
jgi:hypothetical protein